MIGLESRNKKVFFWSIKILAVIISFYYIGYHIKSRVILIDDAPSKFLQIWTEQNQISIFLIILLMIINWSLEIFKWKSLLTGIEEISFIKAARSVLTGVTVSFYTPNRVGEFAGRILNLHEGHRIKGALSAFVGSTAQLLITLQAGFIALAFKPDLLPDFTNGWQHILSALLFISVFILMILWFKIPRISGFFYKVPWLKKYLEFGKIFNNYHGRELALVYICSILRYLVFCTQQYLLFRLFGIQMNYFTSLELSAVSFLLITLIPSIALGELGIRGGINLLIFGAITANTSAILISTFALWFINLAVPALIGAIGLLYIRITRD